MPPCIGLSERSSSHACSGVGWPQSWPRRRGELADDPLVVARLAGRVDRLAHQLHAALGVRHRAARGLAPRRRRRQHHVGHLAGLGHQDVLGDHEVEPLEQRRARAWSRPPTAPGSRRARRACRSSPRSMPSNICDRCQPRSGGSLACPGGLEARARLVVVLDVLEARQLVGDRAHVAAALHVVLAAQRVQARAVAADVAGQQREVDQRQDVVDRGHVLGDAERPAEDRPVGARVRVRELADDLRGHAGDALALLERPRLDRVAVVLEARRRALDEALVGRGRRG